MAIESPRRGILLTLAGAALAAGYLIPFRAGAARFGAESLVLPLLISAAALNTLPTLFRPGGWLRLDRTSLGVAVILGALSALGNEAMGHALERIGPGLAAVLLRAQVLFVALGGWWWLKERITLKFWLGMLAALGGFVLLRSDLGGAGSPSLAGMAWAVVAALSFAGMQLVIRRNARRIDVMVVNSLRLWIAAGLIACVPGRVGLLASTGGVAWALAAGAALSGPVVSRLLMMLGLRHITAAMSTLVLFASPVFAFVLGGAILGGWPDLIELTGCLIILAGIALPVLEMVRHHPTIRHPGHPGSDPYP